MIERITIIGTGLIGSSIGLALRAAGFEGDINGIDADRQEYLAALNRSAIAEPKFNSYGERSGVHDADVIILAVPVLAIKDWMHKLAPTLRPNQLLTDVGSTKLEISTLGRELFSGPNRARFLPGHPMAGKESGGATLAEAFLFVRAMWLFTPIYEDTTLIEQEWRDWVGKFGARTMDLDPERHDELCAWVSHLPQMLSTALAALLEDKFGDAPEISEIGGRALRETTRLGASPFSMWRDVAMTNTAPIADTLLALEQRLAHLRENLRTPELRDEFSRANQFRERHTEPPLKKTQTTPTT
ncbi:prephenate dehydrogenase [Granulicella sp. dw_53]|uniref:prephenate dehydrogenase n=1 Tax=Granulicella sp. dw_53 TaxID=2719792 RepID=UPI001BD4D906|nr:prephenate dehydrogenase [Granulicella sp. dw_53]